MIKKTEQSLGLEKVDLSGFYNAIIAFKNTPASPDSDAEARLKQLYIDLINAEYNNIIEKLVQQKDWALMHPSIWESTERVY